MLGTTWPFVEGTVLHSSGPNTPTAPCIIPNDSNTS